MSPRPYSGIRVLELGSRISASACARLLADLGATVFVIEPRQKPKKPDGKWMDRISALAGKQSVLADLYDAQDIESVTRLIQGCDVVVRSSDDHEADLPKSWIDAIAKCPIVCDITAFGSTGPLSGKYGDESEIQALTGIVETTGLPDGQATPIGIPVVEMSAGLYAASATAIAIGVYMQSGAGQSIEVALYDVSINTLTTFLAAYCAGKEPQRLGNGHGMAVPWNAYPTQDGWMLICSTNDAQWKRIAQSVGPAAQVEKYAALKSRLELRAEVDALMVGWTTKHSLDEIESILSQSGIPCGRIVTVDGLVKEPNIHLRDSIQQTRDPITGHLCKVSSATFRFLGDQPEQVHIPAPDSGRDFVDTLVHKPQKSTKSVSLKSTPQQALPGLRVIEIGQLTTAPLAARHLATLGADVIKVEPPGGESARAWAPLRNGMSHFFVASNGEKRAIELNLHDPSDRAYLMELISNADVLLENMKPGALAKMGFGFEQLKTINPRLIYCAISGFGIKSFYPGRPAVDTVVQAMSGMMDTTRSDGTPIKTGISAADIAGGQTGLLLIIAALAWREKTGEGCAIDISMQDVGAWLTQHLWNGASFACRPNVVHSVADACHHPQTIERELIVKRPDSRGQVWEVFGSPMRLSRTPPQIGSVIGAASKERLSWKTA